MTEINDLQAFIASIINEDNDRNVILYSLSEHRKYANNLINNLIQEKPEYYNIAYYFASYSVQKWAKLKRKKINIDLNNLKTAIEENEAYFGIKTHQKMDIQKETLEITNIVLNRIDTILSNLDYLNVSERKAILDIFKNKPSSKYIISNYFISALEKIFDEYYTEFDEIAKKIENINNTIDDDLYISYHNADELMYIISNCHKKGNERNNNINYNSMYYTLKNTIETLDDYPYSDMIKETMLYFLEGCNELNVSKKISKSRTFVRSRYKEGVVALEILIWGLLGK